MVFSRFFLAVTLALTLVGCQAPGATQLSSPAAADATRVKAPVLLTLKGQVTVPSLKRLAATGFKRAHQLSDIGALTITLLNDGIVADSVSFTEGPFDGVQEYAFSNLKTTGSYTVAVTAENELGETISAPSEPVAVQGMPTEEELNVGIDPTIFIDLIEVSLAEQTFAGRLTVSMTASNLAGKTFKFILRDFSDLELDSVIQNDSTGYVEAEFTNLKAGEDYIVTCQYWNGAAFVNVGPDQLLETDELSNTVEVDEAYLIEFNDSSVSTSI